ncbi:MAG: hypothetical protein NTZ63_06695, partial [Candidatus Omnitrophica bacterium]|nr:hypothetical protein [Candidatus Omnitrophota bacterium]
GREFGVNEDNQEIRILFGGEIFEIKRTTEEGADTYMVKRVANTNAYKAVPLFGEAANLYRISGTDIFKFKVESTTGRLIFEARSQEDAVRLTAWVTRIAMIEGEIVKKLPGAIFTPLAKLSFTKNTIFPDLPDNAWKALRSADESRRSYQAFHEDNTPVIKINESGLADISFVYQGKELSLRFDLNNEGQGLTNPNAISYRKDNETLVIDLYKHLLFRDIKDKNEGYWAYRQHLKKNGLFDEGWQQILAKVEEISGSRIDRVEKLGYDSARYASSLLKALQIPGKNKTLFNIYDKDGKLLYAHPVGDGKLRELDWARGIVVSDNNGIVYQQAIGNVEAFRIPYRTYGDFGGNIVAQSIYAPNKEGNHVSPVSVSYNGAYDRHGIARESVRLVKAKDNKWYPFETAVFDNELKIKLLKIMDAEGKAHNENVFFFKLTSLSGLDAVAIEEGDYANSYNLVMGNLNSAYLNPANFREVYKVGKSGEGKNAVRLDFAARVNRSTGDLSGMVPHWVMYYIYKTDIYSATEAGANNFGYGVGTVTYDFDVNKGYDSTGYVKPGLKARVLSLFGNKSDVWNDSDYVANVGDLRIGDGYFAYSSRDYRLDRKGILEIVLTTDGRTYYQLQKGTEGFEQIKAYYNEHNLADISYRIKDMFGNTMPAEQPYERYISVFKGPLGLYVYTVPIEPGFRGDMGRLPLIFDKQIAPTPISLVHSEYVNGSLDIINDNGNVQRYNDELLPSWPKTAEAYNRIGGGFFGWHIRKFMSDTLPMIKARITGDTEEIKAMDTGKELLPQNTTSQNTWLVLIGLFSAVIGLLGFRFIVQKLRILKGETPKPEFGKPETAAMYESAFKNTVIWHKGVAHKIFDEATVNKAKEQIEWEIQNNLLPYLDKNSRRYFWEVYTRSVYDIFKPMIEAKLESLGFSRFRIAPREMFTDKQLQVLLDNKIVAEDKKNKKVIRWQVTTSLELRESLFALKDLGKYGLTLSDLDRILEAWGKVGGGKWLFGSQIEFTRKDEYICGKELDVFEYCVSYMLQMLVDRVIKGNKPQYREGWIDLENFTGVEDNQLPEGFYITVERSRRFAKKSSEIKEDEWQKLSGGKEWDGCVAIPLDRAIEDLVFSFIIGSFNNNVYFAEYLRDFARKLKKESREKEIVPEVVMTVRCITKIMQVMQESHQERAARGFDRTRDYFDSVEFSLLFERCRNPDGTFQHPFEAMNLTPQSLNKAWGGVLSDKNTYLLKELIGVTFNDSFSFDALMSSLEGSKAISPELLWLILRCMKVTQSPSKYQYFVQTIYKEFIQVFVSGLRSEKSGGHVLKYDLVWLNLLSTLKLILKHVNTSTLVSFTSLMVLGISILYVLIGQAPAFLTVIFLGVVSLGLVALFLLKLGGQRVINTIDKQILGTKQGLHSFIIESVVRAGTDEMVKANYDNAVDEEAKEKIHRALNNFFTYNMRPWPKARELVLAFAALGLGHLIGFSLFGLTSFPLGLVLIAVVVALPIIVSHILRGHYNSYAKDPYSYKKMISYPAYISLVLTLLLAVFGLPYVEVSAQVSLSKIIPIIFAAFVLTFFIFSLSVRIPTYLAYWPVIVSKRWQRRLQYMVMYCQHVKYWAQMSFNDTFKISVSTRLLQVTTIALSSSATILLLLLGMPILAALAGLFTFAYALAVVNQLLQIAILRKRFGIHNWVWSKVPKDIAIRMHRAQLRKMLDKFVEDGHLTIEQRDQIISGKDGAIYLLDTWERLKYLANKSYKLDLEEALFDKKNRKWQGLVWENIPILSSHPATWNDPVVSLSFEEGCWAVEIPTVIYNNDDLRPEVAAFTLEEYKGFSPEDKNLFDKYYESYAPGKKEPVWRRKRDLLMTDTDKQKLKLFFEKNKIFPQTPAYSSEFNNLATRSAGTQWNNFLSNLFHPELLSDTLKCVLHPDVRNHLDTLVDVTARNNEVKRIAAHAAQTALKRLYKEKFETEEGIGDTLRYLEELTVPVAGREVRLLDLGRLKYRMAHILNMYNATSYRTLEGVKLTEELGYRYFAEQTFLGDVEYAQEYLDLKIKYLSDPQGRSSLMRRTLNILIAAGIEKHRIEDLEGIMFRTPEGWVPLNMLSFAERGILLNSSSSLTVEEKKLLLLDEDMRRIIKHKLEFSIVRSKNPDIDVFPGNTDKAFEYLFLPENNFIFDRIFTSPAPGEPPFDQGQTGKTIEWTFNIRGGLIAWLKPRRSKGKGLSLRIDGISEVRPESAAFVPLLAGRLARSNVSGVNFPLYCADVRMGKVPANEGIASLGWTRVGQPWATEEGMLFKYGKIVAKEESEELIISPLDDAAEDAEAAQDEVRAGWDIVLDDNYEGGEGRGLLLTDSRGPNEKYSMNFYEMLATFIATRFFMDKHVPYNVKLTQLTLLQMFYGFKYPVYQNFLYWFLIAVVAGIDFTAGFVVAAFFIGYGVLTSQSINRGLILLYNKMYGLHAGFLKWLYRTFINPGAIGHFSYYVHRYKLAQKFWTKVGKSDFVPTVRQLANIVAHLNTLFIAHQPTVVLGSGLLALYLLIGPFTPSGLAFWSLWFLVTLSLLSWPAIANPRPSYENFNTRYLSPILRTGLLVIAGLISGQSLFFVLAAIMSVAHLCIRIFTRDSFQADKRAKATSGIVSIFTALMFVSGQHIAAIVLLGMATDPNSRAFMRYVVYYTARIFIKSAKEIVVNNWKTIISIVGLLVFAYGFGFLGVIPWILYTVASGYVVYRVYSWILFRKAYALLSAKKNSLIREKYTLADLAVEVGFRVRFMVWFISYSNSPTARGAFLRAVEALKREGSFTYPYLTVATVAEALRKDDVARGYLGENEYSPDSTLFAEIVKGHQKEYRKMLETLARNVGINKFALKRMLRYFYGKALGIFGNNNLLRGKIESLGRRVGLGHNEAFERMLSLDFDIRYIDNQFSEEVKRLNNIRGMNMRRFMNAGFAGFRKKEDLRKAIPEIMKDFITAWINKYVIDVLPQDNLAKRTIAENKVSFEAHMRALDGVLTVPENGVDGLQVLADINERAQWNRLCLSLGNTIINTDKLDPQAFLVDSGLVGVSSGAVTAFPVPGTPAQAATQEDLKLESTRKIRDAAFADIDMHKAALAEIPDLNMKVV